MSELNEIREYTMDELRSTYDYTARIWKGGLSTFPPAIVTCAITGAHGGKNTNPNIPLTIQEQVESTEEAYKAGAVMVHIHCRDPKDLNRFSLETELYAELNAKIRERCPDIIINNTAICGRNINPDKTMSPPMTGTIDALAEVNSIDITNYYAPMKHSVTRDGETVTETYEIGYAISHREMVDAVAKMQTLNIKPEFECFALSDLQYLNRLVAGGYADKNGGPNWVQFVFAPNASWPTPEFMSLLKQSIPANTMLGIIATGSSQFALLTQGLIIGAHVRVGMEDNVYIGRGRKADSNAQLVEKIIRIAHELDRPVATCEQARKMLGLGAPRTYK